MQGNSEFNSKYCRSCKQRLKFERPSAVWGVGDLVMVMATCGLWALLRLLSVQPWRCSVCGSEYCPGFEPRS